MRYRTERVVLPEPPGQPAFYGLGAFRWYTKTTTNGTYSATNGRLAVPLWLVLLVTQVSPAIAFVRWRRRRRLRRVGSCPKCGYDLRGHAAGARCPECGTGVAVDAPAVRPAG
ncbi:MAG: hypothetical protein ACAI43_27060 [Phycisphaerae bacterium]|nr:hypothetical protein [Tepidisphaeraceae bacterium]